MLPGQPPNNESFNTPFYRIQYFSRAKLLRDGWTTMSANPKVELQFQLPNHGRGFSFESGEGQPSKISAVNPVIEQEERGGKKGGT